MFLLVVLNASYMLPQLPEVGIVWLLFVPSGSSSVRWDASPLTEGPAMPPLLPSAMTSFPTIVLQVTLARAAKLLLILNGKEFSSWPATSSHLIIQGESGSQRNLLEVISKRCLLRLVQQNRELVMRAPGVLVPLNLGGMGA